MEREEGVEGQSEWSKSKGWSKTVSVYVCMSWLIDSRPTKSRPFAPLPQLHLANEKHHHAPSTATPLRAKKWEQEGSKSEGWREGRTPSKALLFHSAHGHKLVLAHVTNHKTCIQSCRAKDISMSSSVWFGQSSVYTIKCVIYEEIHLCEVLGDNHLQMRVNFSMLASS